MSQEDAVPLHQVFSDPAVMRYFADVHTDVSQTRDWVSATLREPPETTREFAILRDGHVIGKAGIWHAPELGFLLHRNHWRQGIGTEALRALLPHLHTTMSLDTITADVDPRNAASLALLAKLGFRETGRAARTIRIAGVWCDSVHLARHSAV